MDSIEFNVSIATHLLLFMALFPMVFIWLRRAYRIIFKKDYSEVALKRGEPPENPEKYAPYTAGVNLIAGAVIASTIAALLLFTIFGVMAVQMPFSTWSAIAGSTLWMKIFADYIVSRQARLFAPKKKGSKAK